MRGAQNLVGEDNNLFVPSKQKGNFCLTGGNLCYKEGTEDERWPQGQLASGGVLKDKTGPRPVGETLEQGAKSPLLKKSD